MGVSKRIFSVCAGGLCSEEEWVRGSGLFFHVDGVGVERGTKAEFFRVCGRIMQNSVFSHVDEGAARKRIFPCRRSRHGEGERVRESGVLSHADEEEAQSRTIALCGFFPVCAGALRSEGEWFAEWCAFAPVCATGSLVRVRADSLLLRVFYR